MTSYAIIVQERGDKSVAVFTTVERSGPGFHEEKKAFAIVKELDPRLEAFLRELADVEHNRRLEAAA